MESLASRFSSDALQLRFDQNDTSESFAGVDNFLDRTHPFPMPNGHTIQFDEGVGKGLQLRELQTCDAWKRALQSKCQDYRYYEIVDETLEGGFDYRYLLLEDHSRNPRAIQPVFFVRQNLVEGVPGKIRSIVDGIRKVFPRFLTMRVLMVGCAAGTGDLGPFSKKDEPWVANALQATLRTYAKQNKASLIVLKDFPATYRSKLERFP